MADSFTLDIQRFVDQVHGRIDVVVRKVAFDVFKRVIDKSPVDTGRFKSNWQVAINSVPQSTVPFGGNVSSGAAGADSLARVTASLPQMGAGQNIYLVNNLPYAIGLEYGKSKQAPAGMIRISVAEYSSIVNRAAGSVNTP